MVGEDQDDIVLIPYTTVRKRLTGSEFNDVHAIFVSARSVKQMVEAEHQINQLLFERHRIPPGEAPDFMVQNTTEIADILGVITGTMTLMLASHCRYLTLGWRCRHHEHHAGLGHRTDS